MRIKKAKLGNAQTGLAKTQRLLDEVVEATERMCADSDYGLLFMGLIWHQIYLKAKKQGVPEKECSDNELVSVPIPAEGDGFALFPFNCQKYRKAFNLGLGDDLDWQAEGELLERFFNKHAQFYEKKRSLMIVKMMTLSQEFADRLEYIASRYQLTFFVVAKLLRTMIKPSSDMANYHNSELFIPFPASIETEVRLSLIKRINKEILGLLHEAFGILVVIAQIETFRFLETFLGQQFNVDVIKIFLLEDLCFPNPKFEAWVSKNWTLKQLKRAILWKALRYRFAHKFLARFVNYVSSVARIKAHQKQDLMKAPLRTIEHFTNLMKESPSAIEENDSFEGNEFEPDFGTHKYDIETLSFLMVGVHDSGIYSDEKTYKLEIINNFAKLDQRLILSYTLKGSIINFIAYIRRIIDNIARDILLKEYAKKVKGNLKISLTTLRRYEMEKRLEYGQKFKFTSDNLYYSSKEIDKVRELKLLNQKYKIKDFVTQRELIIFLRNDNFIERLNDQGILLKRQAERIIRKKLEKLRAVEKIPYEKNPNSILYKEGDILQIAGELAKMQ